MNAKSQSVYTASSIIPAYHGITATYEATLPASMAMMVAEMEMMVMMMMTMMIIVDIPFLETVIMTME